MKLINEKAYKDWIANQNNNKTSLIIFSYAERWANLMEKKIKNNKNISDFASATSEEADIDGLSGSQYGMAVNILSKCWVHGEALRQWHNLDIQFGTEGEKANKDGTLLSSTVIIFRPIK